MTAVLLGAAPGQPSSPAGYVDPTTLTEFETQTAKALDFVRLYKGKHIDVPWFTPGTNEYKMALSGHHIAISWKWRKADGTSKTWSEVTGGAYDSYIGARGADIAAFLAAFPNITVVLLGHHEPDNGDGPEGDFHDQWRHFVPIMRAAGVTGPNVIYCPTVTGYAGNDGVSGNYPWWGNATWWPGDDVADAGGYDPYPGNNPGDVAKAFDPFYNWMRTAKPGNHNLPIWIMEFGLHDPDGGVTKTARLDDVTAWFTGKTNIAGFAQWNDRKTGASDYYVNSSTTAQDGWRAFAARAPFTGTPPGGGGGGGGTGGTWMPTDEPGCLLWLTAHTFDALADGAAVTSWADLSGKGHDAAAAPTGAPATSGVFHPTGGPTGGPTVHVNGAEFTLPDVLSALTAGTVLIGVKADASGQSNLMKLGTDADANGTWYDFTDGHIYDGTGASARFDYPHTGKALTDWRVFGVTVGGGHYTAYLDDPATPLYGPVTATTSFRTNPMLFFVPHGGSDSPFAGSIAGMLIYDHVLDAAALAAAVDYLQAGAAAPPTPPPPPPPPGGGSGHGLPGTIVSYAWDFGDGTTGVGVAPTHVYATAGTYTVTLTVTDNSGNTASVSHDVTVAPIPAPPTRSAVIVPAPRPRLVPVRTVERSGANPYWIDALAPVSGLRLTWAYPGGPTEAVWQLPVPPGYDHAAFTLARDVFAVPYPGGAWRGRLDLPDRESPRNFHATGLAATLNNYTASTDIGAGHFNLAAQPNEAVDNAIADGAPIIRTGTLPTTHGQIDSGSMQLSDFLNTLADDTGQYWYIDDTGRLDMAPAPTTPTLLIVAGAIPPPTLGDYVTTLKVIYTDDAAVATREVVVRNAAAVARFGEMQATIDLRQRGAISVAHATAIANGRLSKVRTRARWTDGFEVAQGQVLNMGGVPVDLGTIRPGTLAKPFSIDPDRTAQAVIGMPSTVLIGKVDWETDTVATLTPVDANSTTILDTLGAA